MMPYYRQNSAVPWLLALIAVLLAVFVVYPAIQPAPKPDPVEDYDAPGTALYADAPPPPADQLPHGDAAQPIATVLGNRKTLREALGNANRQREYWKDYTLAIPRARIEAAGAEAVSMDTEGKVIDIWGWTWEKSRQQVDVTVHAFIIAGFLPDSVRSIHIARINEEQRLVEATVVIGPCVTAAGVPWEVDKDGLLDPSVHIDTVATPSPWYAGSGLLQLYYYEPESKLINVAKKIATSRAVWEVMNSGMLGDMFIESVEKPGIVWVDPRDGTQYEGAHEMARSMADGLVCEALTEEGIDCNTVKRDITVKSGPIPGPTEWLWCGTGEKFVVPQPPFE